MKYYLKALGSVCYNKDGITFPEKHPLDFNSLAKALLPPKYYWQRQFGWTNQPEVLIFDASKAQAEKFGRVVNIITAGFAGNHSSMPQFAVNPRRNW